MLLPFIYIVSYYDTEDRKKIVKVFTGICHNIAYFESLAILEVNELK